MGILGKIVDKAMSASAPKSIYNSKHGGGDGKDSDGNQVKNVEGNVNEDLKKQFLGTINRSGPGYTTKPGEIAPVLLPMNYADTGRGRYQQLANATGSGNQMTRSEWYGNQPVTIPTDVINKIQTSPSEARYWRNLAVSSPGHFGQPQNLQPSGMPMGQTVPADNLGIPQDIRNQIANDPAVKQFWESMAANPNLGLYFAQQAQLANTPPSHGPLNPNQIPRGWRPPDPKTYNTPTSYNSPVPAVGPGSVTPPTPTPTPTPTPAVNSLGIPEDIAVMIRDDPKVAAFWDELAANQNNPQYMQQLNSLAPQTNTQSAATSPGYGIPTDVQQAIASDPSVAAFWQELAANQNNPEYMARLRSLG